MNLNELKKSLDVIFRDALDGEVSGPVYGYHDQVEAYPSVDLSGDQIEELSAIGWIPTDDEEGWMFFT